MATQITRNLLRYARKNVPQLSRRQLSISSTRYEKAGTLPLEMLTEEEKILEESVAKFAQEEIAPIAAQMDRDAKIPDSLVKKIFDNGMMGLEIPTQYGGAGSDFFSSILTIKNIARHDLSISTLIDGQNTLIINSFRNYGNEEQNEKWFPRLATDTVGAFGLSEAGSGSDAFALATTAEKKGDYYVINGSKMWISNSEQAGVFLVMANVDPSAGYRGITCFIVERDTPGLTIERPEDKLGMRASSTCPLTFEDMKVHESQILGKPGEGYKVAMATLNEGRVAVAAQMLGLSEGCFEYAVKYTKERKQFGQRIYDFQAMQHQISNIATKLEAGKLLVYNSARKFQAGLPITKEAAMAKYYLSETAQEVCSKSIEWLGGVGFTKDYPIEKYYRDCKIGVIYEGTSNIQLNTIAKMLDKEIQ